MSSQDSQPPIRAWLRLLLGADAAGSCPETTAPLEAEVPQRALAPILEVIRLVTSEDELQVGKCKNPGPEAEEWWAQLHQLVAGSLNQNKPEVVVVGPKGKEKAQNFAVEIDKSSGRVLGIDLDSCSLEVMALFESGLVAEWNASNPERALLPGCRLLAVNGRQDAPEILEELGKDAPLSLLVAPAGAQEGAALESPESLQASNRALREEVAAAEAQLHTLARSHDNELQRLRQECGALRDFSLQMQAQADAEARELRAKLEQCQAEGEADGRGNSRLQASSLSPLPQCSSILSEEIDLDGTLQCTDGRVTALRELAHDRSTSSLASPAQEVQQLRTALATCEAELQTLRQAAETPAAATPVGGGSVSSVRLKPNTRSGRESVRQEAEKSLLTAQVARLQAEKQSLKAKADRLAAQEKELLRIAAGSNMRRGGGETCRGSSSEGLVLELAEARQALRSEENACRMLQEQAPELSQNLQSEAKSLKDQNSQLLMAVTELSARLKASESALAEQPVTSTTSSIASAAAVAAAAAQRIRYEVQQAANTARAAAEMNVSGSARAAMERSPMATTRMPGLQLDQVGRGCSLSTCVDEEATMDPGTERTLLKTPLGSEMVAMTLDQKGHALGSTAVIKGPDVTTSPNFLAAQGCRPVHDGEDMGAKPLRKRDMVHSPSPRPAVFQQQARTGNRVQGANTSETLPGATSPHTAHRGAARSTPGLTSAPNPGVVMRGVNANAIRPGSIAGISSPRTMQPAVRELSPMPRVPGGAGPLPGTTPLAAGGGPLVPAATTPMMSTIIPGARQPRGSSPPATGRAGGSSPTPAMRQALVATFSPMVPPPTAPLAALPPQSPVQGRISPMQRGRCSIPAAMPAMNIVWNSGTRSREPSPSGLVGSVGTVPLAGR